MNSRRYGRRLWLSSWLMFRRLVFWVGALAVGLAAIGFARLAELAYGLFRLAYQAAPAAVPLLAPAGMWLALTLTRRFFPGAEGSGIPQTIAALQSSDAILRARLLSLKVAMGKIAMTLLALCVGASVGREGPTVQVGAAIMHWLGRRLRLSRVETQRGLILAGGAAGVAAAFNTPLAGIVFAIEELSRSFEARTSGTVLTAVILAGITSLAVSGDYHYFGHTAAGLDLGRAWIAVAVCGAAGGLLGGGFAQCLILAARHGLPGGLGRFRRDHPARFAAACGVAMAVVGLASGGITFGTGYGEAQTLLHGGSLGKSFVPLKLLATVLSYLSGIPGGIFAPSLAIGAGVGDVIAPLLDSPAPAAVILLGMVSYFSGVVQAPITAVVIILEMTDNNEMTIPLMAAAMIAFVVSRLVCPDSFYKALAERFLPAADS